MVGKKEELSDFIEKAKKVLSEGKQEILRSSRIGKTLLEIAHFNREKNNIFKELGRMIYKLDKKDLVLPQEFPDYFKKLDELGTKIEEREGKIQDLKTKTSSKKTTSESDK